MNFELNILVKLNCNKYDIYLKTISTISYYILHLNLKTFATPTSTFNIRIIKHKLTT